jgi:beta-N-acetylhexosaminidase
VSTSLPDSPGPVSTDGPGDLTATPAAPTTSATTVPATTVPATTVASSTTTVFDGPAWCADAASWPVRKKVAQLLFVSVDTSSPAQARSLVTTDAPVGGLFLGGTADGIFAGAGVPAVVAAAGVPPLVAVDEEGGRVQRIDALFGSIPSARRQAATLTPGQVRELAASRGARMRELGVTVDFAPVVDVSTQADRQVIGNRSYGATAAEVVAYAGAFADGLRDAGILPTLKHFPGHGRAVGDSHRSVTVSPPLGDLRQVDLVPYTALLPAGPAAVMVGHLDVPGLTEAGVPTSLSPATYRLLREEVGFDGVAVTDALEMQAVTKRFTVREAARRSIEAGADMPLVSVVHFAGLLDHLEAAVAAGQLAPARVDDALRRVLAAKGCVPPAGP